MIPYEKATKSLMAVVIPTCNRREELARCLESLTPGKQEGMLLVETPESEMREAESSDEPEGYEMVGQSVCELSPLVGGKADCRRQPGGRDDCAARTSATVRQSVSTYGLRPAACDFSSSQPSAFSSSYQVIVTDDGRDGSAQAMLADRFPWVHWTQGPRRGPAANRNHGARIARGEWVVFIDDDCLADSGWLQAIASKAVSSELDVIEGRTIIPDKRDSPFLHGVENETGGCYWSCNLAVLRDRFLEIGGFDEAYLQAGGEDMEFAWRFKKRGLKAVFEPKALVLHPQRPYSVKGFLKRVPLLKWSLLYFQQTGQAPPGGSSRFKIASAVVCRHILALLRQAWRNVTGKNLEGWRTRWFNTLWGWVVLPYQLPYLVWWEFKFRRLQAKPINPPAK
jgi:GT2 family glycosyltransferase